MMSALQREEGLPFGVNLPIRFLKDDAVRMQKLLDVLEDLDDVQAVFHNASINE